MTAVADPVERQLDRIARRLDELAAAQDAERRERERWSDLVRELTPVAQAAMALASEELADLSRDVTVDDAVRLARTAARSLPRLEALLVQLVSMGELMHEVSRIAGSGVASVSEALADAEERGWFATARHGAAVGGRLAGALEHDWPAEPPSTLALLRGLRDPRARLGLARVLGLLRALGAPDALADAPTDAPSPRGARTGKDGV